MVKQGIHILTRAVDLVTAMSRPKDFEQIRIFQNLGIEVDGNDLGMIPQAVIRRIFLIPSRITNPRAKNTLETSELGVWSPKSP